MKIAIGCDHRGFKLKKKLMESLTEMGHTYQDFGSYDTNPVDYPDIASKVAGAVSRREFDRGILVCGTGIGMAIAANKFPGIRAALALDTFLARRAREHINANVLSLSAEETPEEKAKEIVQTFLTTEFEGGRHLRRIEKIGEIEKE
ncbi:MAG TPA: ribose 5-phosphate isomerase B [Dehalococcoidia bacterium]|nr:ribose 5-phosphate isomerase B [Dehalococcoidia bacterium]